MELTNEEGRVLGCLVEKQLTTPQSYPLTEKALIAACNQATNRDPVVAYDVSTVRITARSLREKGLLRMGHGQQRRAQRQAPAPARQLTCAVPGAGNPARRSAPARTSNGG